MINYILIFLLPISIYGSKILSYNVYDRTDRVDVMITFDTPYYGQIKQSIRDSKIVIKLQDAEIESSKIKKLSSRFLSYLSITPMLEYTQIVASVPSSVDFIASKTADSYGLRLRFKDKMIKTNNSTTDNNHKVTNNLNILPTKKKSSNISTSYYIVLTVLIIGIVVLFILRNKIVANSKKKKESSWLFKENQVKEQTSKDLSNDIKIRFQKDINESNSVIMLDFVDQSYLVLMGSSNVLLDKFIDNKPSSQEDFEEVLKTRHKELDEFLKVENKEEKEPLQAYKERAASIVYTQGEI